MRVLLACPRPSADVVDLARLLTRRGDEVSVVTERPVPALTRAGVRLVPMAPAPLPPPTDGARPAGHRYLWELDRAVRTGQRAYRAVRPLVDEGYAADVVVGDADEGATLYLPELLPAARLVCEVGWYHRPRGSDGDFFPTRPLDVDNACRRRARNAAVLLQLAQCDRAIVGSEWQLAQLPRDALAVLSLLPAGVDTTFWSPAPPGDPGAGGSGRIVGSGGTAGPDLRAGAEAGLVTFVADSLDPYRGIEPFLRAVALLSARRPDTTVVVVGRDDVPGAWPAPDAGGSWPRSLVARLGLDPARVLLPGPLPDRARRDLLRHSAVHVHLNAPFVPGGDLLEAMSTGALVVGSRTPPVEEVVTDGRNGLLVPFDDPEALAHVVEVALATARTDPDAHDDLRRAAREDVERGHDRLARLAAIARLLDDVVAGRPAASVEGSVAGRLAGAAPSRPRTAVEGSVQGSTGSPP